MADPFIGEIKIFPYSFAPMDYLACQGQTLNASQYQALLALIGNIYGGDGRTNFKLPNLAGMACVGPGIADTTNWTIGETSGTEGVALTAAQCPTHTHTLGIPDSASGAVNTYIPQAGAIMGGTKPGEFFASPIGNMNTTMHASSLTIYQGNGATAANHNNLQPFLVLLPCIALLGLFPTTD